MAYSDPYDPVIAFDDLYGEAHYQSDDLETLVWELVQIIVELHKRMHKSPTLDLVGSTSPAKGRSLHGTTLLIALGGRR